MQVGLDEYVEIKCYRVSFKLSYVLRKQIALSVRRCGVRRCGVHTRCGDRYLAHFQ